jgi:hypothetical protein
VQYREFHVDEAAGTQTVMSAHNEAAAGNHRSELCLNLKAHRERRGIALERVAMVTRIRLHFLRAIEAEEFAELPGGVYNTSYIRLGWTPLLRQSATCRLIVFLIKQIRLP